MLARPPPTPAAAKWMCAPWPLLLPSQMAVHEGDMLLNMAAHEGGEIVELFNEFFGDEQHQDDAIDAVQAAVNMGNDNSMVGGGAWVGLATCPAPSRSVPPPSTNQSLSTHAGHDEQQVRPDGGAAAGRPAAGA